MSQALDRLIRDALEQGRVMVGDTKVTWSDVLQRIAVQVTAVRVDGGDPGVILATESHRCKMQPMGEPCPGTGD